MPPAIYFTQTLILLLAVISASGCGDRLRQLEGGTEGVRRATTSGENLDFNTVHVIDRNLQDWRGPEGNRGSRILVQATNSSLTPTRTVRAWATLQNRTHAVLSVQARTHFFRQDQSPLEQATAWQPIHIPTNGIYNYEAFSLNAVENVGFYYIEVKGL